MQVYLFDIDGTLIVSGGAGRAALAEAMEAAFDVPLQHDVDLHGRTDRWIGKQLLESHGMANSESNWRQLLEQYLQLLPQKLAERSGRVLPGVRPLLEALGADEQSAVGLLTGNARRGADIKLAHFEIDTLVNSSCFGGFGDTRDDRNRLAADALSSASQFVGKPVHPNDVWVIGDTPRDIDCARAIGARAAAVATGGYTMDELAAGNPDLLLQDLSDGLPTTR